MDFTDAEYNNLLNGAGNEYIKNTDVKEKYKRFKDVDPYPEIDSSLLNAEDIVKYILTTGMLDPFEPEKLKGAIYTCTFSGNYLKYNDNNECEAYSLSDDEELTIKPNSISYLEISTFFQIPLYLVLRFNLQVQHVYKGLLLGTGPIVDPGFVGRLYIPLHNFTSNTYIIRKNADLISVEFTKLSIKDDWKIEKKNNQSEYTDIITKLNFTELPKEIQKSIPPNRGVIEYIKKALQENDKFFKEPKSILRVSSSMAEVVTDIEKLKVEVEKSSEKVNKEIDDAKRHNKNITQLSIISIVALLITSVSLAFTAWLFIRGNANLYDAIDQIAIFEASFDDMKSEIIFTKIENKKTQLALLENELNSLADISSNEATQIIELIESIKLEIETLKEEMP